MEYFMDDLNNEKLAKLKKSLEGIISQDPTEVVEEKETKKVILKEQKPKRMLLRANEQLER